MMELEPFELPLRVTSINLDGSPQAHGRFPLERISPQKWTSKQRKLLCVLKRWHLTSRDGGAAELSPREARDILCFHFAAELPPAANGSRKTSHAVSSQFHEFLREGKKNTEWRHVYQHTKFSDPFSTCSEELLGIYLARLHLGIPLMLRARENSIEPANWDQQLRYEQRLTSMCHRITSTNAQTHAGGRIGKYGYLSSSIYRQSESLSRFSSDNLGAHTHISKVARYRCSC